MKPNFYFLYGILICLFLLFSGYVNCASFPTRDCNYLELDKDCLDRSRSSYPSLDSFQENTPGFGSGSRRSFWYHK